MAEEEKKDEVAEAPETDTKEDAPAEAPKEEVKEEKEEGTEVEVPAKFKKLVEEVESMSVLELNELVKVLEKKFGVSAQAVAVAAPGAGGDGGGDEAQDSFTVELTSMGDQKIAVIKVVKEVLGLGLKEAKDMVEGAPAVLKEGVKKEEAEEIKAKIDGAGGTATLK
ncbi:50S ribosomal protein L7/L12 [bacterium]|jgi:large subunit ribosomal protein L7/L12|nr:50S ribosomal protein L7/L12 [bacterium]|tara:strand:- start:3306 stop:3806 length:501 start_codon:yes stop_codon:yes gene_type:complete